ncbi:MAG: META domain-containing protein [Treponema sp.]|nr:META domain-containing protein [Treponema sp.]
MKKIIFLFMAVTIIMCCCKTTEQPPSSSAADTAPQASSPVTTTSFNTVTGSEWKLDEVLINGRRSAYSRNSINREGFGDAFTLSFNDGTLHGKGAPNTYSAPYTLSEGNTIRIALMRSTLMAAIQEPESLREHDFYNYMQNSYKWNVVNDKLELYSKIDSGSEIVLIFVK